MAGGEVEEERWIVGVSMSGVSAEWWITGIGGVLDVLSIGGMADVLSGGVCYSRSITLFMVICTHTHAQDGSRSASVDMPVLSLPLSPFAHTRAHRTRVFFPVLSPSAACPSSPSASPRPAPRAVQLIRPSASCVMPPTYCTTSLLSSF